MSTYDENVKKALDYVGKMSEKSRYDENVENA
jgi:hypothetical protein